MLTLADVRKDRSQYDAARKRSGKSGAHNGKRYGTLLRAPIIAVDGEGISDLDGSHRYTLLACSLGDYISVDPGVHKGFLTTRQCFDFLLSLPKRCLIVGFSINYDECKWFQSIPKKTLEYLWKNNHVKWNEYSIRWAPSKFITIRRGKESVTVYDVFGFYQHSFVASLAEWKVGTPEQVKRITEMKEKRGTFEDEEFDQILKYCLEECELLVQLVQKLRDALIEGDIPIAQWYGAGAIATAILRKEGVKRYLERLPPEDWQTAIMSAYFGGRFELAESGEHHGVYTYDIRSAYPYIASTLPCQTHAVFTQHQGDYSSWYEYGICRVRWQVPDDTLWPPFPFRVQRTNQIPYPTRGEGYYHLSEVRAAENMFGSSIQILETFGIETKCAEHGCDGKPFDFIPRYYAFRDELKKRGSQAQLTIKLGLNSLYGKTAQGVGWGEKKPPYQSYLWAGMITAGTRAMLLDAISQAPDDILWTATDGIVSRVKLDLPEGGDLGEWEADTADSVFCVQTGVYQVRKGDTVTLRSRGFGKRDTDFEAIRNSFQQDPIYGSHHYRVSRFVGLGSALMRTEFWRYFGKWCTVARQLNFCQSKRFPEPLLTGNLLNAEPPIRYLPPEPPPDQECSAPFPMRAKWTDMWEANAADDETLESMMDTEQP